MTGGLRWDRVLLVTVKELRDTLRDRRTLLMMVLVPTLLYPLAGIGVAQLTMSTMARIDREGYTIAVQGPPALVAAAAARDKALSLLQVPSAAAALQAGKAALGVVTAVAPTPGPGAGAAWQQVQVEVLYDSTSARSRAGLERLRQALAAESTARETDRLAQLQLSRALITPVVLKERSVASETKAALSAIAPAVGILLILLSLMGAFYPAIDLVAGERERGTLEPLLSTPTSRLEIVGGKYLCLVTLALATCVLNLLSMTLTTGLLLRAALPSSVASVMHLGIVFELLLATLPVILLVSALLLLTAVFARSFKDAQNLMTPVYVGILLPALGGLLPDIHLTTGTALIPVLGNVLFMKDAFGGALRAGPALLTLTGGCFYALLAIALAARVFDRPDLIGTRMADEGLATLAVQSGAAGRRTLTLTGALGVAGLCLALTTHVAPRLQLWHLRLGLLLSQVLLLLLPGLLCLLLCKVPLRDGLGLWRRGAGRRGTWPRLIAGALLGGAGTFALVLLLSVVVVQRLLHPPEEYLKAFSALQPKGPWDLAVLVGLVGLLPAVCEETLCRGLLLTAARRVLGPTGAVLLAAFFFATLHLDPYRFLNTLVIGALLGAAALRSGTLLVPVLMHAANNSLALLLGGAIAGRFPEVTFGLCAGLLAAGAAGLLAGFALLPRAGAAPEL